MNLHCTLVDFGCYLRPYLGLPTEHLHVASPVWPGLPHNMIARGQRWVNWELDRNYILLWPSVGSHIASLLVCSIHGTRHMLQIQGVEKFHYLMETGRFWKSIWDLQSLVYSVYLWVCSDFFKFILFFRFYMWDHMIFAFVWLISLSISSWILFKFII